MTVTPIAAGHRSRRVSWYWRDAREGAGQLGTPVVDFPADHGGFAAVPEQFGRLLDQVLTQAR